MLGFTIRRVPSLLLHLGGSSPRRLPRSYGRGFTQKACNEGNVQLWSDGGENVNYSSNDNIGGWQTGESTLLNYIDINSVKKQSLKGLKSANEDRIQVAELSANVLFIGVFDGHGGSFVVDFVNNHLHEYIKRFLKQGKSSLTSALRKGFIDCDLALARGNVDTGTSIQDLSSRCGSTATVALLKEGKELVVASIGDSRAILCHDGKAILLTNDHTPSCIDEKNRILACGGSIDWDGGMTPRVNNRLAVTRCFGNFDLKSFGVIAVPEIRTIEINQDEDNFLALVTDGISAIMSTNEAVNIMNSCIDPQESVEKVTTCAAQFGSEDDNTAVLLPFRSFGKTTVSDSQQSGNSLLRNVVSKYI